MLPRVPAGGPVGNAGVSHEAMRSGYRRSRRVLFIVDLIRNGVNNDLPGYSGLPVVGLYEPANQGSIELPVSSNSVPLLACRV